MPVVGVGLAVERYVVDPHVEVRPVNTHQKHQAAQGRIAPSPRQDEADADGNFHHARDEHPDGRVAQDSGDDRLKPSRVGEVLNTDIDVHQTENRCAKRQ